MLRVIVIVQNLDQLEILLDATKTLGLVPELGSVPLPLPSKRRKAPSTNRGKKKLRAKGKGSKPKRYARNLQVRVGKAVEGPPKLRQVQSYLREDFGSRVFEKGLAKGALLKHDIGNPTGYVTQLMDSGGLIAA